MNTVVKAFEIMTTNDHITIIDDKRHISKVCYFF